MANNDNSETNIDTLQNGTDLSKDLYKSLEDELKAEYGMISNTKFNYSLTESSNNIISSGDGGIIRIIYDDLDNNGTDEMIVSRVENQNLAIEVYTVNDNDVNCVPIYCFNNSQEPGDYVTYEMFLTNKYEANANLFIKNLNGDKYLCLEYGLIAAGTLIVLLLIYFAIYSKTKLKHMDALREPTKKFPLMRKKSLPL